MTERESKCIYDLYSILSEIQEKVHKKDLSMFKTSGIGGCDQYQGCPPIDRMIDEILYRHEEIIYGVLRENSQIMEQRKEKNDEYLF